MKDWYVVHCKIGGTSDAIKNIENQNCAVYCPSIYRMSVKASSNAVEPIPMFPRYLFVRPLYGELNSMAINSTKGVSRIVSFSKNNAVISDDKIEEIRDRESRLKTLYMEWVKQKSKKVRIGSFAALKDNLTMLKDEDRIVYLMNLIVGRGGKNEKMAQAI